MLFKQFSFEGCLSSIMACGGERKDFIVPVRDVAKRVTELPRDLNQPIVTI